MALLEQLPSLDAQGLYETMTAHLLAARRATADDPSLAQLYEDVRHVAFGGPPPVPAFALKQSPDG